MYGRDLPNLIHLKTPGEYNPSSYDLFLRKKLVELRDFVECQMVESQKYYDSKSKPRDSQYAVGDPVWLSILNGGVSRKLNSKWEGGWYIAEIKNPVNIIKNKEGNIRVVHINRLQYRILRDDRLLFKQIPEAYNQTFKVDERAVSPLDSNDSELTESGKPQQPNESWEIDVDNTVYENSQQDLLENSKNLSLNYFEGLPQNLESVICSTPMKTLRAD